MFLILRKICIIYFLIVLNSTQCIKCMLYVTIIAIIIKFNLKFIYSSPVSASAAAAAVAASSAAIV